MVTVGGASCNLAGVIILSIFFGVVLALWGFCYRTNFILRPELVEE
jgi:hypothetical protein